jgi:hypothetical protein
MEEGASRPMFPRVPPCNLKISRHNLLEHSCLQTIREILAALNPQALSSVVLNFHKNVKPLVDSHFLTNVKVSRQSFVKEIPALRYFDPPSMTLSW